MNTSSLDSLLAEDHQARVVWEYVEGLDLTCLYDSIRAVEGRAGRDPIDPRILMALWLQATLDGVGAARERACRERQRRIARAQQEFSNVAQEGYGPGLHDRSSGTIHEDG